jgi:excisionase family DNA binding protein
MVGLHHSQVHHPPHCDQLHETAEMNLLTVQDVAGKLSLSHSKIYQMCRKGTLPSLKIEGTVRIDPDDLAAYLEGCRVIKNGEKPNRVRAAKLKHLRL